MCKPLGLNNLEKIKLSLEIAALAAALVAAAVWTLSWSGKSPEMKLTLSASQEGNVVVLKSDIEVNRVDFKIEQVAIKIGENYRIWEGKDNRDLPLKKRLQEPSEVASSEGNLEIGSCDLAAAQILNKSGGITAGDRRNVQCHIPLKQDESNSCVPVVLRFVGKRALPFDVLWRRGEFFAMAVACPFDNNTKEKNEV